MKAVKVPFIIFNVILFASNFILVVYLPKFLMFGWLPSQLAFFFASMLVAALGWGLYFNKFMDTQEHMEKRYKNQ